MQHSHVPDPDRANEQLQPLRRNASQIRIDNGARFGPQASGDLENCAKGTAFPGNAMIRRDDFVKRTLLIADEERFEIDDRLSNDLLRAVGGPSVRVDQHGSGIGKVLGQPGTHRPDHMADRFHVIKAWNSNQNIGFCKLCNLRLRLCRERS